VSRADVLSRFSKATSTWFRDAFQAPTPAQRGAWPAILQGKSTLLVAPTGSGKTLAAFLCALDKLLFSEEPEKLKRCRVLYVSPLKALAVDVERNLRAPLAGIERTADRLGIAHRSLEVSMRTGDTPADERARFQRRPGDEPVQAPEKRRQCLPGPRGRQQQGMLPRRDRVPAQFLGGGWCGERFEEPAPRSRAEPSEGTIGRGDRHAAIVADRVPVAQVF
jgi:Lhr-like helicase